MIFIYFIFFFTGMSLGYFLGIRIQEKLDAARLELLRWELKNKKNV